jgi:hypothetical protein
MDLRLDQAVAERLSSMEPRAVEARVRDATRAFLDRELPGRQGVHLARFEPTARGDLEPAARVHLSCRLTDGTPAPSLTREHASGLQERWTRDVENAFGLERSQNYERHKRPDRTPTPGLDWSNLRQVWARAQARLFVLYAERLGGKGTREQLEAAVAQVRSTRGAWAAQGAIPTGQRDGDRRQVMDVIQLRIEGGSRYLAGALEGQRRSILELAALRAAGLANGADKRLSAVVWPAGSDLQAVLYFNQRTRLERSPDNIDPARLRDSLEARLDAEIRRASTELDPKNEARADQLGLVHASLREPNAARREPIAARTPAPAPDRTEPGRVFVIVDHTRDHREPGATTNPHTEGLEERGQPKERDWGNERVLAIRLRVPTGAEQLDKLGLNAEETAHVIQRAVERAYPFLAREGIRDNFIYSAHDRAIDVRIMVPEKLGWRAAELRSPQFQQRFVAGFHQALAQVAPTRLRREKEPRLAGVERALGIAQAPLLLRRFEHEPEHAAKQALGAVFDKLTRVLPQPFRIMRELGRTVGRFGRTE